jgi:hypothetical protein
MQKSSLVKNLQAAAYVLLYFPPSSALRKQTDKHCRVANYKKE